MVGVPTMLERGYGNQGESEPDARVAQSRPDTSATDIVCAAESRGPELRRVSRGDRVASHARVSPRVSTVREGREEQGGRPTGERSGAQVGQVNPHEAYHRARKVSALLALVPPHANVARLAVFTQGMRDV